MNDEQLDDPEVVAVRNQHQGGDVVCADCDRPASWRVLAYGGPWYTACRVHVVSLINQTRREAGLPSLPRSEVRATPMNPTA